MQQTPFSTIFRLALFLLYFQRGIARSNQILKKNHSKGHFKSLKLHFATKRDKSILRCIFSYYNQLRYFYFEANKPRAIICECLSNTNTWQTSNLVKHLSFSVHIRMKNFEDRNFQNSLFRFYSFGI